jgi:hypothetical protein
LRPQRTLLEVPRRIGETRTLIGALPFHLDEEAALTQQAQRGVKRKHRCPRCRLGFIVFDGATDGMTDSASVCINCGYRVQTIGAPIEARRLPRLPGTR